METLTRLVSESLARHGFDRPLDYRRLQWSRWFRCESHHSLLCVPSKPGVFALAEEIMSVGSTTAHVGTDPLVRHASEASGMVPEARSLRPEAQLAEADSARRMLAVSQFFESDDMAFVLDRMLSRTHSMHSRLESGRYFIRYVEIQDETQRRNICNALNQWIAASSEKATGIGSHFASSLELTPANEQMNNVGRTRVNAESGTTSKATTNHEAEQEAPLEAVTATTVERSPLFPSGF